MQQKKAEITRDNLILECISINYQEYQSYRYMRNINNFEVALSQQCVNTKDL